MFGLNFANFSNGSQENKVKLWLIKLAMLAFIVIIMVPALRTGADYLTKKVELSPEEHAAEIAKVVKEATALIESTKKYETEEAEETEETEEAEEAEETAAAFSYPLFRVDKFLPLTRELTLNDIQNDINDLQNNVKTLQHIVIVIGVILGVLIMLLFWYESYKNESMINVLKKTQKALKTSRKLINNHMENTKKE